MPAPDKSDDGEDCTWHPMCGTWIEEYMWSGYTTVMKRTSESQEAFRNGDWGPKYLCRGPHCEWGIILLKPGQTMAAHTHRTVVEDFYVVEGSAVIAVAGLELLVETGEVVRADPGESHGIVNRGEKPVKIVFIKAPYLPDDRV